MTMSSTSVSFANPPTASVSSVITSTSTASSGISVCDTSGSGFDLNLPASASSAGKTYVVYLQTAGNNLTVKAAGADTIGNGVDTTIILDVATQVVKLICIVTNWVII